jgi:hypothetical protein
MTVRDSAGIEIVESLAPQWTTETAWQLAVEPTVEIGLVEGPPEYLFSNIEGALLLPDGRIAVADRGSSQVRYFTRDGVFESFVGGPGDGPGELGYIRGLGRCGADSLFVFEIDYNNVVFSPAGSYVREARPFDADHADRRPYSLRCASNGYYIAVGWEPRVAQRDPTSGPTIGFYRAEAPAWILAPADSAGSEAPATIPQAGLALRAELGMVLSSERIGHARGSGPHPFGRAARFAIHDEAIHMGTGEHFQVLRYTLDGRLERLIRWPGHDLTIGDAEVAAYREAQLAGTDDARRPVVERQLRDMPLPTAFPAFARLEVDPGGNLWIEPFRRPSASGAAEWTVVNADGALLGTVRVPSDLTVTDIGDDAILGVWRDALGVERIRLYALTKPASGR